MILFDTHGYVLSISTYEYELVDIDKRCDMIKLDYTWLLFLP